MSTLLKANWKCHFLANKATKVLEKFDDDFVDTNSSLFSVFWKRRKRNLNRRRVLQDTLVWVARNASQNSYPIYEQNGCELIKNSVYFSNIYNKMFVLFKLWNFRMSNKQSVAKVKTSHILWRIHRSEKSTMRSWKRQ